LRADLPLTDLSETVGLVSLALLVNILNQVDQLLELDILKMQSHLRRGFSLYIVVPLSKAVLPKGPDELKEIELLALKDIE